MADNQRPDETPSGPGNPETRFGQNVDRKAVRKLRARQADDRGAWFWVGMFGLVGWSVAVPTMIGIALGLWFDRLFDDRISWTLTLLMVGVALGCLNAWYWVQQEQRHD